MNHRSMGAVLMSAAGWESVERDTNWVELPSGVRLIDVNDNRIMLMGKLFRRWKDNVWQYATEAERVRLDMCEAANVKPDLPRFSIGEDDGA